MFDILKEDPTKKTRVIEATLTRQQLISTKVFSDSISSSVLKHIVTNFVTKYIKSAKPLHV